MLGLVKKTRKKKRKEKPTKKPAKKTIWPKQRAVFPRFGQAKAVLQNWFRRIVLACVFIVLSPLVLTVLYKALPPISTLMLARVATLQGYERQWVPLAQIDSDVVRSVLASEDALFCAHYGVDWQSLGQVVEDWQKGERVRGASTLSMQMAKNLFLWPGRSYVRKAIEVPLALYMDFILGKRRLMEIYLNTAEWGPDGIFGIEAGAEYAFEKSAIDLTRREAALLAVILPNPSARDAGRPTARLGQLAGTVAARARSEALDSSCVLSL